MFGNWLLSFLIGCLLVVFAIFARAQQKNWLSPGAFFALFWAVFISIVLFIFPNNYIHPAAVLWIFIVVLAVYVGTLSGLGTLLFKNPPHIGKDCVKNKYINDRVLKLPCLKQLTIACCILGFAASLVVILGTGRSLSDIFDINELLRMGRELSVERYSDRSYRPPALSVFLTLFMYAAGLLGGALMAFAKSKYDILVSVLPIIPAVTSTLVSTTKASILMVTVCFVSSYISLSIFKTYGRLRIFTVKKFLIFFCFIIFIFTVFVTALVSRHAIAEVGFSDIFGMITRLTIDVFGSISSFSLWFPEHWQDCVKPDLGGHTLGGPLSLIGLLPGRAEHVTTEYGNVFTVFRDLIADFTIIGSLIVLFGIGFLGGVSFRNVAKGKVMYAPILMAFYGFTLRSFTGGVFRYSTMLFAWMIFAIYLFIVSAKFKRA